MHGWYLSALSLRSPGPTAGNGCEIAATDVVIFMHAEV